MYPQFDNQFDLGNVSLRWRNGYFSADVNISGITVKQWLYNQTLATFDLYNASWDNRGLITSVNATATLWGYNQTLATFDLYNSTWDNSFMNIWNYNQSLATSNMWNASWSSTYNATYDTWAYNQTTATFNLYNVSWDNRGLINSVRSEE